jgi:capsule polysaccharide export protein KpsE/RkpR
MTRISTERDTYVSPDSRLRTESEEFGFVELQKMIVFRTQLLWDERNFLGRALCLGLLMGVLIAIAIPSQFESSVELMPPDNQSGQGLAMIAALAGGAGGAGGVGPIAGDLLGVKSSAEQFVGILHSRTAEDDLVQRFHLKDVYRVKLEGDARKKLADKTRVSVDRKSGIITIAVDDHDPRRAAAIAQGYVEELDHLVATLSTSAAHRERIFLEGRIKSVKQDLDQAAVDFSQFASKNATLDIKEQGKTMVEAAALLQGQLIAAQSEMKGLQQIYSSNNVRVRSVAARIGELQQQLAKLGGTAGGDSTSSTENQMYPSIRELPILGVTYSDLYRRNKIQEAVYESLTREYELAKVEEAKETPSVKVLDPADVPEKKSFPPRTLVTLLCAMLVVGAACGWLFARHRWHRMQSNDPAKVLAQDVVRSINAKMPWSAPNGSRLQAATHKAWVKVVRRGGEPFHNAS